MLLAMYDRRDWVATALTIVAGALLVVLQGMLLIRNTESISHPIQLTLAASTSSAEVSAPVLEVIPPPVSPSKPAPVQKELLPLNDNAPAQVPVQEVVPAQPQAAPVVAQAPVQQRASNGASEGAFLQDVRTRIERKKVYPPAARSLGMTGVVELNYVIDRLGKLISVEISKSSGFDLLDQAALRAVRAATFAAMPEDAWLNETQKQFKTRVVFSLTN